MSASDKATLVCEALPALSLEAAGRALVMDHMNPDEMAIWDDGELSPGMRLIGTPAFGAIRANSACSIHSKESTNDKGLHYRLIRSEPVITEMRVFDRHEIIDQEKVDREVQVWIRDNKAHVELQRALQEAAHARQLAREGNKSASDEAFEALYSWFPDPTLFAERGLLVLAPTED